MIYPLRVFDVVNIILELLFDALTELIEAVFFYVDLCIDYYELMHEEWRFELAILLLEI